MTINISKYKYLWDGTQEGWCLLKSDEFNSYSIVNEKHSLILHLDDPSMKASLCNEMLSKNIKVINNLPDVQIEIQECNLTIDEFWKD